MMYKLDSSKQKEAIALATALDAEVKGVTVKVKIVVYVKSLVCLSYLWMRCTH